MASNRELAMRARELGRARGVEVDTRGLDNAGLTALVERLEAEPPIEVSTGPDEALLAAEAPEPEAPEAAALAEDDGAPETATDEAPRRRRCLVVAPERAVLCARGVHLHAGDEVLQGDFDLSTLRRLMEKGTIVESD